MPLALLRHLPPLRRQVLQPELTLQRPFRALLSLHGP
jgi:hypothetical protein